MKVPNHVRNMIDEGPLDYDPESQRAELLKRNKTFLQELEGIRNRLGNRFFELYSFLEGMSKLKKATSNNVLLIEDWPKPSIIETERDYESIAQGHIEHLFKGDTGRECEICEIPRDSYFRGDRDLNAVLISEGEHRSKEALLKMKWIVLDRYISKWWEFCNKWNIDGKWEGKLSTLPEFMNPLVTIDENTKNPYLPICINIGPRTSLRDLQEKWPDIERIQKALPTVAPAKSQNFWRDLLWYDLNKKYKQSAGNIAQYWAEKFPKEIDFLAIKSARREAGIELTEDDTRELLYDIYDGTAPTDIIRLFEYHRNLCMKWPHYRLADLIKKAIKNLKERVDRLETLALSYPPKGKIASNLFFPKES